MSVDKVTSIPPSDHGQTTLDKTSGSLNGMRVTVGPASAKRTVKTQITDSFLGVGRLFKTLRQRMSLAKARPDTGPRSRGQALPRLPDGSVNVEALFDHTVLVRRLKVLADDYGRATSQAVKFLEMAQQLPLLDSTAAARVFVDAVRSEFTSDCADLWSNTGGNTLDLDARLRAIKEKASSPQADSEAVKAEIYALVGHMKASQLKLVATDLLPALQAEFR